MKNLALINNVPFQNLSRLLKCCEKLFQNRKLHCKMAKSFKSIPRYGEFFPQTKKILQQTNSLSLAFVWNFTHAKWLFCSMTNISLKLFFQMSQIDVLSHKNKIIGHKSP